MPISATFQRTFQAAGLSFGNNQQVPANVASPFSVALPAAPAGALSTRTDGTTGTLTMGAGHGITTGARLDIFWAGGARRGVTVGTVAVNSVPFSGGLGDTLPAATTAVTAFVPVSEPLAAPGATLQALAVNCPVGGIAVFVDSGNAEVYASVRTAANPTDVIVTSTGTNPFGASTVAKVYLSQSGSGAASTVSGVVMYN